MSWASFGIGSDDSFYDYAADSSGIDVGLSEGCSDGDIVEAGCGEISEGVEELLYGGMGIGDDYGGYGGIP